MFDRELQTLIVKTLPTGQSWPDLTYQFLGVLWCEKFYKNFPSMIISDSLRFSGKFFKKINFHFFKNYLKVSKSHIDSTVQAQSRPYTLLLKDLYDPVNPDKDTVKVRVSASYYFSLKIENSATLSKVRRDLSVSEQEDQLLSHLRPLLQKAKYEQLPDDEVKRLVGWVWWIFFKAGKSKLTLIKVTLCRAAWKGPPSQS